MSGEGKSKIGTVISAVLMAGIAFGMGYICKATLDAKKAQVDPAAGAMAMMGRVINVTSAMVGERVINPPLTYMSHVEPEQEVDLRAQVSGYIDQVKFKEGSTVKAGDVLFQIDDEIYRAAVAQRTAELEKAKAEAERSKLYYDRMQKVDARSVTQTEIDNARAAVLQANAAVTQGEANLLQAQIDLKHTQIVAPISGRIGAAAAKKGDYVAPSTAALARIVQMDPIRVVFSIPDKDYVTGAMNGIAERLRARLLLSNGDFYTYEGKMDFIGNEMSSETASLPVRYLFKNDKGVLLANAYATISLDEADAKPVLAIPELAVLKNAQGSYVYVVQGDGVVMQPVKLGRNQGGYVAVTGLTAGQEIVLDGVSRLNPMSKIKVVSREEAK